MTKVIESNSFSENRKRIGYSHCLTCSDIVNRWRVLFMAKPVKQKLTSFKAVKMTREMFVAVLEAANQIGQSDSEFIREAVREHLKRCARKTKPAVAS